MKRSLALFDFDGTLTLTDSFTAFIFEAVPPVRLAAGKTVLAPLVIAYKLGLLSGRRMRASMIWIGFRGRREADVLKAGQAFATSKLPQILRRDAMERLEWHKGQGDSVVVVSASLDVYLSDWCRMHGVDLLCSKLASREGVLCGRYEPRDCSGEEKSRRILERYNLKDFHEVYAYGDTFEDLPMLSLATHRFYRGKKVDGLERKDLQ